MALLRNKEAVGTIKRYYLNAMMLNCASLTYSWYLLKSKVDLVGLNVFNIVVVAKLEEEE